MDLFGLCALCDRPGAMNTCILCGRLVCNNCFDQFHCLCSACKAGKP